MSKRMKEYWASMTPAQRKERNRNWQRAGVEATHTPEHRAKQSRLTKKRWEDPEYKAKHSAGIQKAWDESPPERREKLQERASNLSNETKRKRSEGLRRAAAERSDEHKEEIADKIRQTWKNKSKEELAEHGRVSSENLKKYWASLSPEEKRELTKGRTDIMHTAAGTYEPTSIEIAIQRALNQLGIEHGPQENRSFDR